MELGGGKHFSANARLLVTGGPNALLGNLERTSMYDTPNEKNMPGFRRKS